MTMFNEYPQDTLSFDLTEETTLTSDTVKIAVPVNAIVQPDQTEDQLRQSIKESLRRFIASDWNFGAIKRQEIQIGVERCTLTATTRVHERENHNLKERARQVSIKGSLELGEPVPDYTMPNGKIQEGHAELRLALLNRVKAHAAALSGAAERVYRISKMAFNTEQRYDMTSNRMGATILASASAYASGGGDVGEDLSHSTKIIMTASVELSVDFLNRYTKA